MTGSERRRVLVVGAPFGDGHMRAAEAVGRLLVQRNADLQVTVADICAHLFPPLRLDRALRGTYRWSASRYRGRPHRALYRLSGRWPGLVCGLVDFAFGRAAANWLRRAAPHVVIATHPVVGYLCARHLAGRGVPVVCLVTDSGPVNRIWFHGRYDRLLLTDPGSLRHATGALGAASKIAVVGAPVLPALRPRRERAESRHALGLDQRFTVLLTAGGAGLGQGVLTAARQLASSDLDVQLILNAGDNKKLLARFHDIARDRPCLVRGSAADFDALLAACDLVVGKAGWFTLNEAILCGRPTLIVDVVPGQEECNAQVVEELRVARRVPPAEIVAWVSRYAHAPDRLRREFTVEGPAEFVAGWPARLARALAGLGVLPGEA